MIKRILCDIVLFGSLFLAPWYWTAVLAAIFVILFPKFWEGVVAAFFIDSFYSISSAGFYAHFGMFTASALAFLLLSETARSKIRFFS